MRRRPSVAVVLALALAACGRCGKPGGRIAVEPLPAPPAFSIERETLPGAGPGLEVVAARPQGPMQGEVRPTITFSRPVVALGTVEAQDSALPAITIAPAIPGAWRWLGSASVEFVPSGPVPYATRFTVTVPKGLAAVDGSALAEAYTFTFETPRPNVQAVIPADGWAWLEPRQAIALVLDQPVKDLAGALSLTARGKAVPFDVRSERLADLERKEKADRPVAVRARPMEGFTDRRVRYELQPREALPLDSEVVLEVARELAGEEGPLAMEAGRRWTFRTYGPLELVRARRCPWDDAATCPYGPVQIQTTNPLDRKSLRAALSVEPPVGIAWDELDEANGWQPPRGARFVNLPGAWRPGTTYRITLSADLADTFGQRLGKAATAEVRTDDLAPELDPGAGLALIEGAGDGALPVRTVNLEKLEVALEPLDPAALARRLSRMDRQGDAPITPVERRTLDVSAGRNRSRNSPVPVREMLAGHGTRLFALELDTPQIRGHRRVVGQLTDLAVHAKLGATSGMVWVTRLSDGKPVPKAALALHDAAGEVRWTGTTDADGLARVPGLAGLVGDPPARWNGETPFALVAARDGDDVGVTLSTWAGGLGPWSFSIPVDWDGTRPRPLGGVFAERGIYRPGETAHLKGIARVRRLGELRTPGSGSAKVTVKSARGKELLTTAVPLTAFGTWSTDVALPPDADLGTYAVEARLDGEGRDVAYQGAFRVEEYRAPQFQVDVVGVSKQVFSGDRLTGQVTARYLFGGAMPGATVRWTATRSSIPFEPPGNTGFAFGAHSWWWDDNEPEPSGDVPASGEGTTDAAGVLAVDAGTVEATGGRTWGYTLEAEVTDVNRQRLAGWAGTVVHPAQAYAGLHWRGTGFAESGKPGVLEVVAAAPDGKRQEGLAVQVEVKHREWKWIRKKGVGGEWHTESEVQEEKVGGCDVKSAAAPAECAFTPPRPGLYVAEATVTDGKGRKQTTRFPFYAIGSGWVSWQRNDTGRLDLVADKQRYEPGETARILVKSPYPDAEAVLTVEREGVSSVRRVKLAGAASTLEVPIGEDAIPNVFVSVVAVRGRVPPPQGEGVEGDADPGRPEVRIGYVQLAVEKRAKRLDVSVVPDAPEKRPRDRVTVQLAVTDHRGQGVAAEVTAWAVDEGVLRLTAYQVPDPVEMLHPPRGLSVRVGEPLIHLVERRKYGEKGLSAGGGGGGDGAGAGFRSQFRTTVLFAPEVHTGADGKATVTFDLPDNLTTYRIMAVAIGRDDRSGSGQGKVAVARPLMALPALPRLARVGDRFEAGVVVHAPSGKIGEATVEAQVTGLVLEGETSRRVTLEGGRPREVRFPFRATAAGEAVLRFAVAGGGERDGVEQRLRIELPVATEAVAVHGDTDGVRTEAFAPPGGVRPEVGGLDVTLASTALGGFAENMRQLVEYPYGCLEQLSSRLVPFVALREIQGEFGLPHEPGPKEGEAPAWARAWLGDDVWRIQETRDPDEVVRRTVKAIESLQDPGGGYRYWASSTCVADWASAYAVLALGRAAELGYPVDREALGRGQGFLAGTVAAGQCTRCQGGCFPPGDPTRVFALYALARTHAPKASYYPELHERRAALPLFAQAMLADAMFVGGGDRSAARKLLQEILNHAKETPSEVHLEESDPRTYATLWSSDVRTNGIVLQTLATISPDHPWVSKLAAYLAKVRKGDGRFTNTQEAAYALMALAEVVRTKEKAVPDFTGRVTLGGKPVAESPFHGRSTEVKSARVPMKDLPAAGGKLPFEFRRDGAAGVLYYGALLRYAPAEMPATALERGLFVQRWVEPYEGGGQVRAARAGDLVRVRVRIGTPQERHYVAIEVPVPAGLEIVDTSLATTAHADARRGRAGPAEEYDEETEEVQEPDDAWGFRFWSPFVHEEKRDAKLVLFADRLPPGLHVATFVARATTPGTFVLQPAHAEEMYTPEVFGRSDGGTFEVKIHEEVASR